MVNICLCGRWAAKRTTWIDANVGIRFLGCVDGENGCGYFRLVDALFCNRSKGVIVSLLRGFEALTN